MTLTVRVRATLWYAALLGATLGVLGAFLLVQMRADLRQAVDDQARASSAALARSLSDSDEVDVDDGTQAVVGRPAGEPVDAGEPGDAGEPVDVEELVDAEEFVDAARGALPADGQAQVLDAHGVVRAQYGPVAGDQALVPLPVRAAAAAGSGPVTASLGGRPGDHRVVVTPLPALGGEFVLVVAVALPPVQQTVGRVLALLLLAGPAALGAAALAAHRLAARALRPVERMTADAGRIGTGRLHDRLAVPAVRDEVGRLARTVNGMLDRIERGVLARRRLVADASHELRTPLAVIRAEIDLSLRDDELSPAAREVLCSAAEEVGRMARTVDNLLTLSESEHDRLELATRCVDLRDAVDRAVRPLLALAAAKSVTVTVAGEPCEAWADPARLHLALTNLTENAIKFTAAGGVVGVHTWQRGAEVGVTVVDDGPGVGPQDRDRLFDRFTRTQAARSDRVEGSGLGLAICREVALAHDGRIWVDSPVGGGSAFTMSLPAWRSPAARPGGGPEALTNRSGRP